MDSRLSTLTFLVIFFSAISGCSGQAGLRAFISSPSQEVNIAEGQSVPVCVNLTEPADRTVTITTIFRSDTISLSDFSLPTDDLVFTADGPTELCITLDVLSDDVVEQIEQLEIQIGGAITIGTPGSSNINIVDGSRVNVTFTQESYTANESDGAISVCAHVVGGTLERAVSITFIDTNLGTASPSNDFFFVSTTRTFSVGATASDIQCAVITIFDDNIIEDEFINIGLTGDGSVSFILDNVPVVIAEDEGVQITMSPSGPIQQSEGNSGLTDVNIGMTVSWPAAGFSLDRDVVILFTTVDSGATAANNDFIPLDNKPFVIPRSATNGEMFTFTAQIVGDVVQESSEIFSINVNTQNPNDSFQPTTIRVFILDDGDVLQDCGQLSDPDNGNVTVNPNTLQDSVATYSCDIGYNLIGAETRTCLSSGMWNPENEPRCQIVDCGNPPSVINGEITSSGTTFQQQAIYSCVPGYELSTGTPTVIRVCQANMTWSGETPECTRISCGDLIPPANSIVNFIDGNTLFESRAQYVCNPGYEPQGNTERVCQANGLWSSTAPTCNPVSCGPLTNPDNGAVQVSSIFFPGMANYSCNTNFELVNGPQTRMCQTDATWSDSEPSCQVITCPQLNNPANGQFSIDVSSTGNTTATYTCDEGYELSGNSTRKCQLNSQWSGTEPTCQIIQCPMLTAPINGSIDMASRDFQSEAVFSCDRGFNLIGANTTTCQSNGLWSSEPPNCNITNCDELSPPINGSLMQDGTIFRSEALYDCNEGFSINGSMVRICEETGMWSGEAPTCDAVMCPEISDVNGVVTYTADMTVGSESTLTCNQGFVISGPASRTCMANGTWSGSENSCNPTLGPTDGQMAQLSTPSIIGLAIGGAAALIILIVIISVSVLVCCRIRKKKIYQKYVLPYRSYIYANSQRNSSGPITDAEIKQWESQTRQHAVDAVDALGDQ